MPAPYLLDTNILLVTQARALPARLLTSDAVLPRYSDLVTRVVLR